MTATGVMRDAWHAGAPIGTFTIMEISYRNQGVDRELPGNFLRSATAAIKGSAVRRLRAECGRGRHRNRMRPSVPTAFVTRSTPSRNRT
jgi:hypothetical protein